MNFLVDAHLPRRLVYHLRAAGHDALHMLDLPEGNRTKDYAINERSQREQRVVVTKDADFVTSFQTSRLSPRHLWSTRTWNSARQGSSSTSEGAPRHNQVSTVNSHGTPVDRFSTAWDIKALIRHGARS